MSKRLIELDDELLNQARDALGTKTIRQTVTTALEQAVRGAEGRRIVDNEALERFAAAAADLNDDEVMRAAWR